MSLVRTATLPASRTDLTNPVILSPSGTPAPIRLLSDQQSVLFATGVSLRVSSNDASSLTVGHSFPTGENVEGAIETNDGELLVSTKVTGGPGTVYRSTGWNPATADATSWTKVLTCGGSGVYVHNAWGFSVAPSWSKHAGMIFACEYGPQADATYPTADPTAAVRVYASSDNGATWREIFNVLDRWPGETRLHTHCVAYDPWQGRVYVSQGDGGNAHAGHSGIWYSDDPTSGTPTWTAVAGSTGTTGVGQVTTIRATEAGIVCLPDGPPHCIQLIPRRAGSPYIGPMRRLLNVSGNQQGPSPVGFTLHRNGGLESPQAGAPLWAVAQESSSSNGLFPAAWVSYDGGLTWREGYRHASAITTDNQNGLQRLYGPTTTGKVIGSITADGTLRVFTADFLPPAINARTNPSKFPHRLLHGMVRLDAAAASITSLFENGSGITGGSSGAKGIIYLDPAEHDQLRVELDCFVNAVATGCDLLLGLFPVTAVAGAAATVSSTVGSSVASSVATIPAASLTAGALARAVADFTCPAAGYYLMQLQVAAPGMTASSSVVARGTLKARAA